MIEKKSKKKRRFVILQGVTKAAQKWRKKEKKSKKKEKKGFFLRLNALRPNNFPQKSKASSYSQSTGTKVDRHLVSTTQCRNVYSSSD
jgi:hypothetical protein